MSGPHHMNDSNASHQSDQDPHETDTELEGALKASLPAVLDRSNLTMADQAPTSHNVSPDLITTIKQNDVLMGRGSGPNEFMGNQRFRSIVESYKEEYKSAPKNKHKKKIAHKVIGEVRAQGGRFLKQVKTGIPLESVVEEAIWREAEEKVALEKCQQALRQKEKPVGTNESRNTSAGSSEVSVDIAVRPESFGQGFAFEHPTSFPPTLTTVLPGTLAGPSLRYAGLMFFLKQQAASAKPMAANPVLSPRFNFCVENSPAASRSQGQEQCDSVNSIAMRYLAYCGLSPGWIERAWTQTDSVSSDLAQSSRSLSEEKMVVAGACAVPTTTPCMLENGASAAAALQEDTDSVSSDLAQSSRFLSKEKMVVAGACAIPTTTPCMLENGASAAAALQEDIYRGDAVLDEMLDQMYNSSATSTSGPPVSEIAISSGVPQEDMLELFFEHGLDAWTVPVSGRKRMWSELQK